MGVFYDLLVYEIIKCLSFFYYTILIDFRETQKGWRIEVEEYYWMYQLASGYRLNLMHKYLGTKQNFELVLITAFSTCKNLNKFLG